MLRRLIAVSFIATIGIICSQPSLAEEIPGRISVTDKEIIERLTRLEERVIRLEEGQKALNKRIDDVNVSLSKRIEDINKRIDDTNRNIDDLQSLMLWGFGILFTMLVVLFGYIVWDRRTALQPVMERTRRAERLLDALREYSRTEPKLAETLRSFRLL